MVPPRPEGRGFHAATIVTAARTGRPQVTWIQDAKRPETRRRRVERTIGMLRDGGARILRDGRAGT